MFGQEDREKWMTASATLIQVDLSLAVCTTLAGMDASASSVLLDHAVNPLVPVIRSTI